VTSTLCDTRGLVTPALTVVELTESRANVVQQIQSRDLGISIIYITSDRITAVSPLSTIWSASVTGHLYLNMTLRCDRLIILQTSVVCVGQQHNSTVVTGTLPTNLCLTPSVLLCGRC
jgi:hypothetical protein